MLDTSKVTPFLNDGDIICRLGDRIWSSYFKNLSLVDKRFSHLGVVRIRDGKISVINAEGQAPGRQDFVNEVSLEEFFQIARSVGIYRINSVSGTLISDVAMDYKGYPFNWEFDLKNESKIYCTQLLYVILKRIAPEIVLKTIFVNEVGKEIVPLEAISNSPDFNEIIYVTY